MYNALFEGLPVLGIEVLLYMWKLYVLEMK